MEHKKYFFSTEALTVGYDGKPLISDITIGVEKGEILTLIGPNGSGKSTILKSITKHLSTISGVVYIDNKSMRQMSNKETATRLSVVLTERVNPEMMTCGEMVATGRYPYTNSFGTLTEKDRQIVQDSLCRVHALDLYDREFSATSDGQRQRIMLARAICQEPEIIVLDEPTSFLDIRHKIELLGILREMAKGKNITVIMSLHEIDLAYKISDKIMCVKGDHITDFGTPEEIFTEGRIDRLYEIENGAYDVLFGSVELEKPSGSPKALVIGGNGTGIPFYRVLQKLGVPFAAGILFENDMDYRVAVPLAAQVIAQKAFTPITPDTAARAMETLGRVDYVIDCGCETGEFNRENDKIMEAAVKCGKKIIRSLSEAEEIFGGMTEGNSSDMSELLQKKRSIREGVIKERHGNKNDYYKTDGN